MTDQKIAVVTGASRRLGLFLCEHLAQDGYHVLALTRSSSEALMSLSARCAVEVIPVGAYQADDLDEHLDTLLSRYAAIDLLIHNASVFEKDGEVFDFERYRSLFEVHMALPAQLNTRLRAALDNRAQPGNIIHITDIYADIPNADYAIYCSTKAALESLSKSFAIKFAPGIRVNTIQPGPIKFLPSHTDQVKNAVLNETLLGYEGGFAPIYQAIVSIVANTYMTGASIKVDGGRALGRG